MKFAVGQPVTRIEDTRLITGEGNYTDDIKYANMCHGVFVRSPYAHAKITNIDIDSARSMPGLSIFLRINLLVLVLPYVGNRFLQNKFGSPMNASKRPILASEKVRHVGIR